jgi:hypothetical protein
MDRDLNVVFGSLDSPKVQDRSAEVGTIRSAIVDHARNRLFWITDHQIVDAANPTDRRTKPRQATNSSTSQPVGGIDVDQMIPIWQALAGFDR